MQFMFVRRLAKRFTAALAVSCCCATGFIGIASTIDTRLITAFDSEIIGFVQGFESDPLTEAMMRFTWLGTGMAMALITIGAGVILYTVLGHRKELVLLASAVGGSGLLNILLKLMFQRTRPAIHRIAEASGYSFPSGHSMAAFSLYATLAFLLWKHVRGAAGRTLLLAISAVFIATIGISRIYLGVHYPSDVIGGYLASACWLFALIWAFRGFGGHSAVTYLADRE